MRGISPQAGAFRELLVSDRPDLVACALVATLPLRVICVDQMHGRKFSREGGGTATSFAPRHYARDW